MRHLGFKPWEIDEMDQTEYTELITGWNMEQREGRKQHALSKMGVRR